MPTLKLKERCPEMLLGVDTLARAIRRCAENFRLDMSRDDAQANVDARCLLIELNLSLLDEIEASLGVKKPAGKCR